MGGIGVMEEVGVNDFGSRISDQELLIQAFD